MILLGRVHGAFGVRGELKLESFTEPASAIFRYQPWTLRDAQGRERELMQARGRETAKGLIATFPDVADRDAAEAMRGTEVYAPRSALPPPKPGEYYWVDLEGLRVVNLEGADFGVVSHLFSTGANEFAGRYTAGHFDIPVMKTTISVDSTVVVRDGVLQDVFG